MFYFCTQKTKTRYRMLNHSAYFYGYYFYFASNCEAADRM